MLPSWATDTVTRLRATVITQRGSEIPDWTNPDSLEITGCSMQPAGCRFQQNRNTTNTD